MKKPAFVFLIAFVLSLLVFIELRPWHNLSSTDVAKTDSTDQASEQKSAATSSKPADPAAVLADKKTGPESVAALQPAQPLGAATLDSQPIRAQLSPVSYTTISAELSAKVQEMPKREGDYFKKGDTLVVFDCSAQRAQLQKSQALLAIAERNFRANEKLIALGSASRIEFENSRSEFEKTKAEVEELTSIIGRCVTLAPYPGRVVEQRVRSYQFVQAGQALLEILDSGALELEFIAPSRWAAWIRPGYGFKIQIDETDKSYPAVVTRVGARIDSVSQTIKVVAMISGMYRELSPGMSGTLMIKEPGTQDPSKR